MANCTTYIRLEWTGTEYVIVDELTFDYDGPWGLCKETTQEKQSRINLQNLQAKAAENYYNVDMPWQRDMAQKQMDAYMRQAATQEQLQRQGMGMQQQQFDTYSQMVKDALAKQYAATDPVVATMTPYLSGTKGFDDTTLRMMNDEALSNVAGGYGDANAQLKARLLAMSGGMMPGGPETGQIAELEMGRANAISGARRNIALENARQMLLNQFNAGNTIMGAGAQYQGNVGTGTSGSTAAAGGFNAGANTYATAPIISQPGVPAMLAPPKPPGFWGGFGSKLLGMGINSGLSAVTGGFNSMLGGGSFTSGFRL